MKKVLSLLLISIMMLTLAACTGGGGGGTGRRQIGGQVIIGNTTELTGDWITTFTNNAADNDILNFISGYSTVDTTLEGDFVIDETVVKELDITPNADGTLTYTFTINRGLLWCDGTEVTAEQYVGGLLLWNHNLIRQLGGHNTGGFRFAGHRAFADGDTEVFSGIRLLADDKFSITVSADFVPFFFGLAMVSVGPTRLDFWVGDVEVRDDGNGAFLYPNLSMEAHGDHFRAARDNPIYPSSGPYKVDSFDRASLTAVLKINENFAGSRTGQLPSIETVIYKRVIQDTMMDELATGSVDVLLGILQGEWINEGFDLVERGGISYLAYPRAGYGFVNFVCDFGPTQFVEVRRALIHFLDRNEFARTFTGGFGNVINVPAGEGQWFFKETQHILDQRINTYEFDPQRAIQYLVEGGWNYTATGADWTPGSGPRHKLVDGAYMPLVLQWASTEQNQMSDLLVVMLAENEDLVNNGVVIEQTVMTFTELLSWYRRDASRDAKYGVPTFHMFNLATNFLAMYDMTKSFSQDPADLAAGLNANFILDDELERLAAAKVLRSPEDREGFLNAFAEFAVRWNYLIPTIPLYANILHDFYNDKIQGWQNSPFWRPDQSILYAWVDGD